MDLLPVRASQGKTVMILSSGTCFTQNAVTVASSWCYRWLSTADEDQVDQEVIRSLINLAFLACVLCDKQGLVLAHDALASLICWRRSRSKYWIGVTCKLTIWAAIPAVASGIARFVYRCYSESSSRTTSIRHLTHAGLAGSAGKLNVGCMISLDGT